MKSRKTAPGATKNPAPAKSAAAAKSKAGATKADFVRSLAPGLSAQEVVAKAKEAGITINSKYVYAIRPAGRKKARKVAKATQKPVQVVKMAKVAKVARVAAKKTPRQSIAKSTPAVVRAASGKAELARLVLRVGFDGVESLLGDLKKAFSRAAGEQA